MALLLVKRGKFMTGHSYATGFGYKFSWSAKETEARRFADFEDHLVNGFAKQTGATIKGVPNTKAELKQKGRHRLQYGT